jgi:thiamine biosynthesis lipoprotein
MRFGKPDFKTGSRLGLVAIAILLQLAPVSLHTESFHAVEQHRYAMGTMFDIVAYHESRDDGERAVAKAMEEVVRLDQVMSHFKADSDLSRLVREGRRGDVRVEPSLFDVIQEALMFSRRSNGKFDVTIAPLLRTWTSARAEGRNPSADEISEARRCVGYEKIEASSPDRIRLRSDCVEIDLGGIGKGYAVDRAIGVLKAAGIRHALINAGSSSIASIGSPPERQGWPVLLNARVAGHRILLLRDRSISTSEQSPSGGILDPQTGTPAGSQLSISVVAPSATVSDALSTTLLMLPLEDGMRLVSQFAGVSALWMTGTGELKAAHGESQLQLSGSR